MMKMNKFFYGTLLLALLTLFFCCMIIFYYNSAPAPKCHANIRYNIIDGGKEIKSNISIDIFFKAGYASVTGGIQLDNTLHHVRRDLYFEKENHSGATILTKEIILPGDNISNELWEHFFIPRPYNTPFFSHIEKLTGNLYYVGLASSPYFICVDSD